MSSARCAEKDKGEGAGGGMGAFTLGVVIETFQSKRVED